MTQLLARLPTPVRLSLVQNASTAGSQSAIAPITAKWGDRPTPDVVAALDRFEHYMSLTVEGRRVGPVQITGPYLDEVFADYARPRQAAALERAARTMARAEPLSQLNTRATDQLSRVNQLLAQLGPATRPAVRLQKKEYQ